MAQASHQAHARATPAKDRPMTPEALIEALRAAAAAGDAQAAAFLPMLEGWRLSR